MMATVLRAPEDADIRSEWGLQPQAMAGSAAATAAAKAAATATATDME
jgi:hypothetical protein